MHNAINATATLFGGFFAGFSPGSIVAVLVVVAIGLMTAFSSSIPIFGSINQLKIGTPQYNRWYPCPSGITSGMAVLIGTMAACAQDAYDASTGGATFNLDGSYSLTVIGQSTQSPNSVQQINPGDELYATGTLDPTTGITYNLTIDKTRGNCPFGNYEGTSPILAGVTNTSAPVRLKIGGSPGAYGA